MIAFPVEATTKYLNTFGLISAPNLSQIETSYKAIVWGIVHLLKMGAWITKQIDTCAYGRKLAAVPLLNGKRQHLKVISRHNLTNKDIPYSPWVSPPTRHPKTILRSRKGKPSLAGTHESDRENRSAFTNFHFTLLLQIPVFRRDRMMNRISHNTIKRMREESLKG